MKFTISTIVAFVSMGLIAQAHPGDHDNFDMLPASELAAREVAANARAELVRNCGPQIAAFEAERRAKRNVMMKRATSTSTAAAAKYTTIQNTTCVTAPEVTEGAHLSFYAHDIPSLLQITLRPVVEYYRTDLRESQKGVNLVLDIGIMVRPPLQIAAVHFLKTFDAIQDTRTCKPLPAALVELWACNATGAYGGFTTSGSLSDKFTWLRGGSETNANGVVELTTIYPGFYTGRTIHIHTMVHTSWTKSANGTIVSHSGSLRHIGQLFFQESLNDQVVALAPYTSTKQRRTLNSGDGIYAQQNSRGFNGVVATELMGSTVSAGIL
ncbi:hypothetical protein FRC09_010020, partial [Ceratobasidium sp. 395]